jgi:hypothetical protein
MTPGRSLYSHICVVDGDGANERVVYSTAEHFEAPNWSPDGTHLLLNSRGRLWRLPLTEGCEPILVPTGAVTNLNNDHGISPDGALLAISAGPICQVRGRWPGCAIRDSRYRRMKGRRTEMREAPHSLLWRRSGGGRRNRRAEGATGGQRYRGLRGWCGGEPCG